MNTEDYMKMLRTAASIGMNVIPKWRAAQIMAILMVWGNNEGFVYSPKFICDKDFICETYHLEGGESPDVQFAIQLRMYAKRYERVKSEDDLAFQEAKLLMKERYDFNLTI